ncbi:MAG: aspartate kinase [Eubacteriales bacterium]|nr:aspartate kinase [Eubacteriales bacterium]
MRKVCKFGGSSLANAGQIQKVIDIVSSDPGRQFIVVSAPGKGRPSELKITDLLIGLAKARLNGFDGKREYELISRRITALAHDLNISTELLGIIEENILNAANSSIENAAAYEAQLKAQGEDACARILAEALTLAGIEAHYMSPADAGILLYGTHDDAEIDPQSYTLLSQLRYEERTLVIPGFYGISQDGEVLTFSRGGSDISGAIIAAGVDAEIYEIWTDVDSVYAVNPELVDEPKQIKEISYREMRELAYLGASVVHPEAMLPIYNKAIPIHILNTNNPDAKGTKIVRERSNFDGVVTGISGSRNFCSLNISEYLLNRRVGIVKDILSILAEEGVSFEHMPSSIDSLSIILRDESLPKSKEENIIRRLTDELELESVELVRGLALVMLVGEAMADTVGVTSRAVNCLSAASISLEMIIQDHSEMSVIFVVDGKFCNYAIETLYYEYF